MNILGESEQTNKQTKTTMESMVELTLRNPLRLLDYGIAMTRVYAEQMPGVENEVFAQLWRALLRLQRCKCRHCYVPQQAALAFWWMCTHHGGAQKMVQAMEPPGSVWRQDDNVDVLFKFVAAHVLSIKNSPITRYTALSASAVFHTSMFLALERPSAYWLRIMAHDGQEATEKKTKEEKVELIRRFGQPISDPPKVDPQFQYLSAGCWWVEKSRKKAGSGGAPNSRNGGGAGGGAKKGKKKRGGGGDSDLDDDRSDGSQSLEDLIEQLDEQDRRRREDQSESDAEDNDNSDDDDAINHSDADDDDNDNDDDDEEEEDMLCMDDGTVI